MFLLWEGSLTNNWQLTSKNNCFSYRLSSTPYRSGRGFSSRKDTRSTCLWKDCNTFFSTAVEPVLTATTSQALRTGFSRCTHSPSSSISTVMRLHCSNRLFLPTDNYRLFCIAFSNSCWSRVFSQTGGCRWTRLPTCTVLLLATPAYPSRVEEGSTLQGGEAQGQPAGLVCMLESKVVIHDNNIIMQSQSVEYLNKSQTYKQQYDPSFNLSFDQRNQKKIGSNPQLPMPYNKKCISISQPLNSPEMKRKSSNQSDLGHILSQVNGMSMVVEQQNSLHLVSLGKRRRTSTSILRLQQKERTWPKGRQRVQFNEEVRVITIQNWKQFNQPSFEVDGTNELSARCCCQDSQSDLCLLY